MACASNLGEQEEDLGAVRDCFHGGRQDFFRRRAPRGSELCGPYTVMGRRGCPRGAALGSPQPAAESEVRSGELEVVTTADGSCIRRRVLAAS
jgi:hypothetical protein